MNKSCLVIFIMLFIISGCKEKTLTEQVREGCIEDIANPKLPKELRDTSKLLLGMSYIVEHERDVPRGMSLIKDAAESGHAKSQEQLAGFYLEGQYFEKNTAKAIEWYQKAAAQGNQDAKNALAKIPQ